MPVRWVLRGTPVSFCKGVAGSGRGRVHRGPPSPDGPFQCAMQFPVFRKGPLAFAGVLWHECTKLSWKAKEVKWHIKS